MPIYTVNCQFFALNLKKFTPAKKNLHGRRPWRPWQIWGMIGDIDIEMVEKELRTSKTWIPFFWRWLNWRNRNRNGKPRWDLWPQSTKRRKSCYCKLVSEQRFKQKNMDGLMIDISEMSLFLNWTTKGKIPGFLDGEVNYWRREERDVN